jgi:hypothetical protein
MKKITLLIAVFCLIASNAIAQPAQLAKGNIMLGVTSTMSLGGCWGSDLGGFGFSTHKVKYGTTTETSYKMTSWNLLPKAGYFVMDNLVTGIELMVSGYMEKDVDDGDKDGESQFGIGPFVRYYYPLKKVYPYAEVEAMFGSYKETWINDEYKEGLFMFGGGLGVAVPLGDKITFDAMAGYSHVSWTEKDEVEGEAYTYLSGGFGIRLGFSIYLPLK